MQAREKVGKSDLCLQGVENRLAKAAGAEPAGQMRKIARGCGAKHISKSKCTKHTRFGPLLEVETSKSARRYGAKHISNVASWLVCGPPPKLFLDSKVESQKFSS